MEAKDEEDLVVEDTEGQRYRHARNGDHIMGVPFECELCHFRNMNKRDPIATSLKDSNTLMGCRRGIIDVCWAREPKTVSNNLSRMCLDVGNATESFSLGDEPLPGLGETELVDRVGMRICLITLLATLRRGDYTAHIQYETARKTPTWYGNLWEAGQGYSGFTPAGVDDVDDDYSWIGYGWSLRVKSIL